jgi:hypothetical protein
MSENSPEDWRQVCKERRAVTHTDEHRANNTPVCNQFQELSEHQEDPTTTPSLAPRKLIVEFTRRSATDPSDSSSSSNNDGSSEDNNSDIPEEGSNTESIGSTDSPEEAEASDTGSINNSSSSNNESSEADNNDTGSIGSTESFDTMTDITNDYGCLMEIIRLVNAKQATVFRGKKKNYADIVKFREVLGSALATQPCSGRYGGYSWLVDTEEDYTHRVGATTPYTVQSMPKGPPMPMEPPESASSSEYKRYTINQQKYNKYLHWNKEALAALEHRFPKSLTPKRNKFEALPITYTIREAVDYLKSLVNTDVEKRETYCAIVRDISPPHPTCHTYYSSLTGWGEHRTKHDN